MANLLSMLGLGSSGVPTSLDDETAQLMQQSPTSGWSALMGAQQGGISPQQIQQYMAQAGMPQSVQQDDGSQASAQDANAVANSSTGNVASQDSKVAKGDAANAVDAQQAANVDQSGTSADDSTSASGSANAAPNNSDNASTASNASADQSGDTASSPDASTSSQGGLLSAVGGKSAQPDASSSDSAQPTFGSKLMSVLKNPLIDTSLMNAGFGMMAASRPGTPWYSAIGQGAQTGVQTYNQLAQQQIANRMAALNYQRQNALDQADINAKNAGTAATQQKTAQTAALQAYASKAGGNFDPSAAVAAGADPQAAMEMFKTLHPNVTVTPMDDAGNMFAINPQTGQIVATVKGTKLTPVGTGVSMYNFGSGGATNGNAGGSSVGQVSPQPLVQGGLAPADVAKSVAGYNATQKQYTDQAQIQDQFLNQMQTKQALTGTGAGGVVPQAFRQAENLAGVFDNNSSLRQQFQGLNIQKEMSLLPAGSRMDQTFLKMIGKTIADPSTATPEQMMQTAAFARSVAQRDSVDSEVRAAFVGANGGMETPLSKPTTITVQGRPMHLSAGTTMQQAADAATSKLVDWDPPLINPKWADGAKINDEQIQQALQFAKDPAWRSKARAAGILLPSNMRNGGQ
ncbi:hypothetical protein [Burkholderia multivorans]|uniref:hypothetical protein n=1 Tax=Burkholderia multivorans TaxID=87883 RepID=UPI0002781B38|nr:hypothetical protein [Burkholderia multivorans]EJO57244.1 hypothetical protein BURMUCF2_A1474 [Burkholderia multivorans CF2]MBU9472102.1 hypothetical protein [Burkholderia multivorans]